MKLLLFLLFYIVPAFGVYKMLQHHHTSKNGMLYHHTPFIPIYILMTLIPLINIAFFIIFALSAVVIDLGIIDSFKPKE